MGSPRALGAPSSAACARAQVQNDALDAAVMPALVALLGGAEASVAGAPAPPPSRGLAVRTKAIFGLGQLLRGNRRAQRLFVTAGGPALLREELQAAVAAAAGGAGASAGLGLQAKVLALLTDLVGDAEATVLPSLVSALANAGWCEAVGAAAEALGPDADSRTTRELALQAMLALQAAARSRQCDAALASRLATWRAWHQAWEHEAQLPGDEGAYPEQLAELAEKLVRQLGDAA